MHAALIPEFVEGGRVGQRVVAAARWCKLAPPFLPSCFSGGYGGFLHELLNNAGVAVQHAGGFFAGGQDSNTVKGLVRLPAVPKSLRGGGRGAGGGHSKPDSG
jgi:hypothetical protein